MIFNYLSKSTGSLPCFISAIPIVWEEWGLLIMGAILTLLFIFFQYRFFKTRNSVLEKKVEERTELLKKSRSLLVSELEERLHAEEELRKSQFQFSQVWDKSADGMRITDENGVMVKVNEAFCMMTGKTKNELEGHVYSVIYKTNDQEAGLRIYKERFSTRSVGPHYESEVTLWNGRKAWFGVSSSFLEFENRPPLLLLIFRDVTEKKNAENALKEYATELEATNRKLAESEIKLKELNTSKDKFFSIISHDLRSPFNSLLGITSYLMSDSDRLNKGEIKELSQNLYASTNNIYNLLEGLLQWSRLQDGRIEYNPKELSLHDLISGTITLLSDNASIKNIKIEDYTDREARILADENMITSVFRNLISNAIKFTREHGRIRLNASHKNGFWEIEISDNGVGIDPDILEKLFMKETNYTTLGTAAEKGSGLGLVICREFLELHGGRIFVESELNHGTTFRFTIPEAKKEIKKANTLEECCKY
ncbi:MAG: ATP-binding protein [Ignavibacteriales bacterium]